MFELDDLSFTIDQRTLLHPLSLEIPAGRTSALIGHNGSGKSTLIKLLARQQRPSSGAIRLDGRPLDAWPNRDFARRVAYLPQRLPDTDGLSVRELVSFGRYPWHGALGRFSDEDHAQVERALTLTATQGYAARAVDQLSGGERQRVWLAMLLAQNSGFLLLDEPTSALDIAHQAEVLALVHELSQQLQLGVLVVMHDINMAARYSDHLIALHSGRLLAQGPPEQMLNSAMLERIYGVSMGVMPHPRQGAPICYLN